MLTLSYIPALEGEEDRTEDDAIRENFKWIWRTTEASGADGELLVPIHREGE